jgi:PPOX class probable F420-dependent enzyme
METVPEAFNDLLSTQLATLATVGASGKPQLSVVWFLAEDGVVRISLSDSRQKTSNLKANNAASVLIIDPKNGFRYLEIRGRAEIAPDTDYAFANKVGAKYGADLRAYDAPGDTRLVVTIVADRVRAVDMSG